MNVDQLNEKELLLVLETELYRRSYFEFFKAACKVLEPATDWDFDNFHFRLVADILHQELERIIEGRDKDRDYVFNLPFRSGKSLILTIIYPAYVLMRDPTLSIGCVSATQDAATKFSHKTKMLIESDWYQQHFGHIFQLRTDSHAKADFMTNKGGRISAFGMNSVKIGGQGFSILTLDDPQSLSLVSPIALMNTIDAYRNAVHSRILNPSKSVRFLIQQRIHENDLTGWCIKNMPDKFHQIVIPAMLSKDLKPSYLASNYTNNLFWEKRFSQKVLDDFKLTMKPNMFSGNLQQRPQVEEGDLIRRDWFRFKKLSEVQAMNLTWSLVLDTSTSEKTSNDPSGFLLVARSGNDLIIRKAARKWVQFYQLLEEIKEWKKVYNYNKIYCEEKSSGIQILQELRRATNWNVLSLSPMGKSKTERVLACQPQLQAKRVILVEDDSWNEMFLSECASVPYGVYWDLVDCLTYSVSEFLQKSGTTIFK